MSVEALPVFGTLLFVCVLVVGIVKPLFPSLVVLWFALFLHALTGGFALLERSFFFWTACGIVALYLIELVQARTTVQEFRMTFLGVLGGVIGGFVGLFFGLVPGLALGPVLGVIAGQILSGRDVFFSIQTRSTRILGHIGLTVLKLAYGFFLIGSWVMAVYER